MKSRTIRCAWLLGGFVFAQGRAFGAEGDVAKQSLSARVRDGVLTVSEGTQITINGVPAKAQKEGLLASAYDRIEVAALSQPLANGSLTLAAWVATAKPPRGYQTVLFKGDRSVAPQRIQFSLCLFDGIPELKYMDAAGKWRGIMRNGKNFVRPGGDPIPLAGLPRMKARNWHQVAATFSNGEISVYLDGKIVASGKDTMAELVPNAAPLTIGVGQSAGGGRDYLLPGLINNVLILNRALGPDEIRALHDAERASKPAGAVSVPRPPAETAAEHAFETTLPLVKEYEGRPAGTALNAAAGVTVERVAEGALLRIGGQLVYPMAMMPEPYVGDQDITRSCHDFAAAGVDLYSGIFWSWMTPRESAHSWWLGPGEYDFERIDARIRAILTANPKALVLPRLKLNPPRWWLTEHPDEMVAYADGKLGPQASMASREWTASYSRMLRDVIGHMEKSDYADRIFGYHPSGGGSSEWFWWGHGKGPIDFSPAAVARWREWLTTRYGDDQALAKAWGNPQARVATATPPAARARDHGKGAFLRLTPGERPWADYREFLSDTTSGSIAHACAVAKEACGNRKIVGVFYGYSMYCNNILGFRGLHRVMTSPGVDFLSAPTSYRTRRGGDPGAHISAYNGSMRLHGKLYWDEVDHRTHLFAGLVNYRTETIGETLATMRRSVGHSLTRGTGLWYFLLAGNTTFHDQQIMADIAHMKVICDKAIQHNRAPAAEVAVFADEASMHLYDTKHPMAAALGIQLLDELARAGAPYDLYLLEDIANAALPDYRVYVFPNAFRQDAKLHAAIKRKVRRNGATVLWTYAPGFAGTDGGDVARMAELTGIQIDCLPKGIPAGSLNEMKRHPITSGLTTPPACAFSLAPAFTVVDKQATVLARNKACAGLAVREFPAWRSVYSLLAPDRELLLGVYRYAGVHVYCDTFDTVGASRDYLMIHTASAGPKTLRLPQKCDVTEQISGKVVDKGIDTIHETLPKGETRIYRLAH